MSSIITPLVRESANEKGLSTFYRQYEEVTIDDILHWLRNVHKIDVVITRNQEIITEYDVRLDDWRNHKPLFVTGSEKTEPITLWEPEYKYFERVGEYEDALDKAIIEGIKIV